MFVQILLLSPRHQEWARSVRYVIFDEVGPSLVLAVGHGLCCTMCFCRWAQSTGHISVHSCISSLFCWNALLKSLIIRIQDTRSAVPVYKSYLVCRCTA